MDPSWGEKVAKQGVRWKKFVENDAAQVSDIRREIAARVRGFAAPLTQEAVS